MRLPRFGEKSVNQSGGRAVADQGDRFHKTSKKLPARTQRRDTRKVTEHVVLDNIPRISEQGRTAKFQNSSVNSIVRRQRKQK
jgi:hypothetical protein